MSVGDQLLQVETVEAGKGNVADQAARARGAWPRQKFLCRGEGFRLPTGNAYQYFESFAHRDVIVDDEHGRYCASQVRGPSW